MKKARLLGFSCLCIGLGVTIAFGEPVVRVEDSFVKSNIFGGVQMELAMSEAVPVRTRYLENPYRIVLEFDELNFGDLPVDFGATSRFIKTFNFGLTPSGSRIVMSFDAPYVVSSLNTSSTALDGKAGLKAEFSKIKPAKFTELATELSYKGKDLKYTIEPSIEGEAELPLIVIDPGHGGVDPGAIRDGVSEKTITMEAARVIANKLLRSDRYRVALTRDKDIFVSLVDRRRIAEQVQADLFLSIHADTVEVGDARGTTIYMLSEKATNENAAKFALFENRVDLFAGQYLEGPRADLSIVLTDMAQTASLNKALDFAKVIQKQWIDINQKESESRLESAAFAVLKAPDVPSLLLEIGYLSNEQDRARIQDEEWLEIMSDKLMASLDVVFYGDVQQ